MVNQENCTPLYVPITSYSDQPIRVGEKEIEASFDLYKSQDGKLGWSKYEKDGKSTITPINGVSIILATRFDISDILSQIAQKELKMSNAPDTLKMLLDNEDLVACIEFELDEEIDRMFS